MSSAVWDHTASTSRTWFDLVRFGFSFVTGVVMIAVAATSVGAFDVQRMSVASDGAEGDASSTTSAVSADGRVVAFVTGSSTFDPGDQNLLVDVYLRDRAAGTTERVSAGPNGEDADGQSATPALSADGRYVAFTSAATNLVPGDGNGRFDVFVRDRDAGTLELVSVASDGAQLTGDSIAPAISADGRYVAFASAAALVPADTNAAFDVYVRDRVAQTTTRVSVASDGTESDSLSLAPRISADGSVVVFHSFASNLVANDTNNAADVFAHDRATGATTRVSVSSTGAQGTRQSVGAQVSGDGRFVAFDSDSTNLVAGDANGRTDVFVHDRTTGVTERVSVSTLGGEGNNQSGFMDPPALSHDGRWVAFTSGANNLVPDDTNNRVDVMLRDRQLGTTTRVNVAVDGTEADGSSTLWANLSADGSVVVFASSATNLVADDTNFVSDVFAWIDTCGNAALDPGESCDDGNRADGDCCSSTCQAEPSGSTCDDGNLCTQGDACDGAGACGGGDPVVCPGDAEQCGSPAVCDPASGACVAGPPADAGTPCDDGDLCTQSDTCDGAGACVGADPVVCAAGGGDDACGGAGTCDPATGACVGGPAPDGTACDDGDPCTVDDACVSGACAPGDLEPAACVGSFQCYAAFSWQKPFWWYDRTKVRVEDLFEDETFKLGSTQEVCSALTKPDGQNATRLACVRLQRASGSERTRTLAIANALGSLTLRVGKAKQLCLPAGASGAPGDPGLDAFKCHAAEVKPQTPRFTPVSARLTDEFGSGTVDVVAPDMVCNPASVADGGVLHERVHQVCYRIQERRVWGRNPDAFRPRTVTVTSANGRDVTGLVMRDHFCVPSTASLQ